jgi:hypothetical protein
MNYKFENNLPQQVREDSEKMLDHLSWLLPGWLQTLFVTYETTPHDVGDAVSASINVKYEYRYATLRLSDIWAGLSPEEKYEVLIHELLHLYGSIYSNYIESVIAELTNDGPTQAIIMENLRTHEEAATQDLAYALHKKLNDDFVNGQQ